MNILVLTDNFPPLSNAGAERIAYLFSKEYIRQNHNVSVITINTQIPNGSIEKFDYEGMSIYQIGSSYNKYLIAYISLYNPWVLKSIRMILDSNNFDLSHIHNIHSHISYKVMSLLEKCNITTVLTTHDAMSVDYGKFTQGIDRFDLSNNPNVVKKIKPFKTFMNNKRSYNPLRNIIIKHYLKKVDNIVTVSNEQRLLLLANGIDNMVTIHNGIPKQKETITSKDIVNFRRKYNIKEGDRLLLWAGRLSEAKGSKQVLEVLKKTKDNDIKLLVAGKNIFKGSNLEKYIISTGWLSSDDMEIAYKVSSITLVPSICYDMFPTVVLESMRHGCPVISGCFGGAKEAVVDGETGYVINPFDIENFYKKIIHIIDDDGVRDEMSENSKKVFNEKFTVEICIKKYLDIVNNV